VIRAADKGRPVELLPEMEYSSTVLVLESGLVRELGTRVRTRVQQPLYSDSYSSTAVPYSYSYSSTRGRYSYLDSTKHFLD